MRSVARVFGIVGRDGGHTAAVADACVVLPPLVAASGSHRTPRASCAVVWHLLVSHPSLQRHDEVGARWPWTPDDDCLGRSRRRGRRRIHRQSPRRPAARRQFDRARHGLRQLQFRAAMAPGSPRRRPSPRRGRGRRQGPRPLPPRWPATTSSCTWPRTLTSLAPMSEPDHRLRRGHLPHPERRRGDAARAAPPASLYASGSGVYGDLGEVEARRGSRSAGAGFDLRCQQARGRGPHLRRTARMFGLTGTSVPLRERGRASADPRRGLRLPPQAGDGPEASRDSRRRRAEQVVHPRRRRPRCRLPGARDREWPVRGLQRGDGRLHHRDPDRRARDQRLRTRD